MKPSIKNIILILIILCTYLVYHRFNLSSKNYSDNNIRDIIVISDATDKEKERFITKLNDFSNKKQLPPIHFLSDSSLLCKILRPQFLPISCVFDNNNKIIDIIPGTSFESFKCIIECISLCKPITTFHYNQLYDTAKLGYLSTINSYLDFYSKSSKSITDLSRFDYFYKQLKNPYILYQKILLLLSLNQKDEAKLCAKQLLKNRTYYDIVDYKDEFLKIRHVIDSTYTIDTAPQIYSSSDTIYFNFNNNIRHGNFHLYNKGGKALEILETLSSCSCIDSISLSSNIILPKDSCNISFKIYIESPDEFERTIYIISDAINEPIKKTIIICNAKM